APAADASANAGQGAPDTCRRPVPAVPADPADPSRTASCRAWPRLPADPDPRALAERIRDRMPLPAPMGQADRAVAADTPLKPRPRPQARRDLHVAATARGHRVTVVAVPHSVRWEMGDGTVLTCEVPDDDCSHTYTRPSHAEPEGAYTVTATLSWQVGWHDDNGDGGALEPLTSEATRSVRVRHIEAQLL
ncbi:hypothetical protein, partial [Nocardiopsis protaetiae]